MLGLFALLLYAMLLLSSFLKGLFGDWMDLYLPKDIDCPKPVIVFVTGGAWILGYKAWGALLGLQLAERDIIMASIDYRNFPQCTINNMVEDVSQGISFAIKEFKGDSISLRISHIKAYFGLSGSIMEGEESLKRFSPEIIIEDPSVRNVISIMPPVIHFHGIEDFTIPPHASITFVENLKRVGALAELILYEGKAHTDLFVRDPLRGDKDELFDYIVSYIHPDDGDALSKVATTPTRKRLCP
ncbi:hypothetical protein R6Q57_026560 [Mikania cordata]